MGCDVADNHPAHDGMFCSVSELSFLHSIHVKSEKLRYIESHGSGCTRDTLSEVTMAP